MKPPKRTRHPVDAVAQLLSEDLDRVIRALPERVKDPEKSQEDTETGCKQDTRPKQSDSRTLRVLIADGHQDSGDSLAMVLDLRGHTTRCAYDGPRALRECKNWMPDVVVLELALPGLSGLEFATCVRRDPSMRHIRLVAVTGCAGEKYRRLAEAAGFNAFFVKPVQIDKLTDYLACSINGPRM